MFEFMSHAFHLSDALQYNLDENKNKVIKKIIKK